MIIPTYNEETTIEKLIKSLEPLNGRCEILFVDGGSTDRTVACIGRRYPVIKTGKGRAVQMNEGAKQSTGDVLFFLHCDSEIPKTAYEEIEQVMSKYEAGCFGIAFHSLRPFLITCRVISNHRVKDRKVIFGDQGIFLKRELFFRAGMFPELPIMEDYQFTLTLTEMGIKYGMTEHRIFTSDRRFRGSFVHQLKIMWKMNRLRAMYRRKEPIEKIAAMYQDIR